LRQISATGCPSAPCFKMNAFCASVNFDAFTAFHSSQPGKSEQKTLTQNDPIFREQSRHKRPLDCPASNRLRLIGVLYNGVSGPSAVKVRVHFGDSSSSATG
jgi:hypothetical protein